MGELQPYLEELLELSQRQEQVLEKEDIDTFQELVDLREKIIVNMKRLNLKPDASEKEILQKINILDEKNNQELKRQLELVKAELRNLNHYNRRDKTYMDPYSNMGSGMYFDKHDGR